MSGRRALAVGAAASLLVASATGGAIPLQELVEEAKPSVAHLTVLSGDGEEIASGSGFVVSADGHIVTNFHVVHGARRMEARFADGKARPVEGAVAFDADSDLAILKVAGAGFAPLPLATSEVRVGDPITVIGSPRGLAGTVSTGVVSAVRNEGPKLGDDARDRAWSLQISAPTSPGSSGSPVLNQDGEAVGVAVGSRVGGQALNFAIPVSRVRSLQARTASGAALIPLGDVRSGNSRTKNLLISAGGLSAVTLVGWIATLVARRRRNVKRGIAESLLQ